MLILKGSTPAQNVSLNSRFTHVPAGISGTTSPAGLRAGLLANAGQWNRDFPLSTQSPTGLLRPVGSPVETRAFQAGFSRQMLPRLELVADVSWNENRTNSLFNPAGSVLAVAANAASNPFTVAVRVAVPDATDVPRNTRSRSRRASVGAVLSLPRDWTGALDYTRSENRYKYFTYQSDNTARTADLTSGVLNPFKDTLLDPVDFSRYLAPSLYDGTNRQNDVALRASGPLPLPWGPGNLTVGLERRTTDAPERTTDTGYPITILDNQRTTYYARKSTTDSGYLEATAPLVEADRVPLVRSLELQLSGRSERYQVDTGTLYETVRYNRTPPQISYVGPTVNSLPFFSQASYTSNSYTAGLKYQPLEALTFRVSRATALLPPLPVQLISDPPRPAGTFEGITDPLNNNAPVIDYEIVSGGNPGLTPQNSRSFNAGVIFEPRWRVLPGLRLNAEYYRIEQFDAIGSLTAQQIVNQEEIFPGRVARDPDGTITRVDASSVNLYRRDTEGWDFSADWGLATSRGQLSLHATGSVLSHLRNQFVQERPAFDAAGYHPAEGGTVKHRSSTALNWESGAWSMAWSMRYVGSYKTYGVAGGPEAVQRNLDVFSPDHVAAQGSDTISSQRYHDLFVGYSFARTAGSGSGKAGGMLDGLSVQFGVNNVFDRIPPLDAYYANAFFLSPYGEVRLRTYWLGAKLGF